MGGFGHGDGSPPRSKQASSGGVGAPPLFGQEQTTSRQADFHEVTAAMAIYATVISDGKGTENYWQLLKN
jgi:hypothetical protein